VSFGLIVGTATVGDAEQLRAQFQSRIEFVETFWMVDADDVCTHWSDGNHDVYLASHRSYRLRGKEVVPSVQLSIEPAERSSTPGD
jgi:hypothetical protein